MTITGCESGLNSIRLGTSCSRSSSMRSRSRAGTAVLLEKDRWNEERNMQQAGRDENGGEQAPTRDEGSGQAAVSAPETQQRRRKIVGCLLQLHALRLSVFALLALC